MRLWIVNDESVRFIVFVSSSSFSSAALSDWWHVLISQMYLSLSFLLKSISRLLLLGSAYTIYRPAERGWEDGDTSLLMFMLFGDVIWKLYFHSQTFPSVCGWFPQSSAVGWRTLAVKHLDTLFILFSRYNNSKACKLWNHTNVSRNSFKVSVQFKLQSSLLPFCDQNLKSLLGRFDYYIFTLLHYYIFRQSTFNTHKKRIQNFLR